MIIDHNVEFKFLPVSTLKSLLSEIPDDFIIWPNAVGNLSVFRRNDDDFDYVGIIDFLGDGDIDRFENFITVTSFAATET